MTPEEIAIRNKLLTGIQVSYNELVRKRQQENEELYFSHNGRVVGIKARDLNTVDIKIPYPHSK
ncbi:hypothetical protein GGR21_002165 [Dysgonomonas hofstadii]|uniref:Uncharacterized protein n=1 Tax=Dysgonomonas hofstadii TaxID=637886 RepID=A0A840CWQ1_9BACT|nr:hypothetical protein [Dysgonomonas hofstadii]MBB4036263.1 hypothetical protein [Dysgonomonas hofstadii]